MSWKKVLYTGILCCAALLFQHSGLFYPEQADLSDLIPEQTDFLSEDDGRQEDCQLNDQALAPLGSSAYQGRHNSTRHSARVLNYRRLQARYADCSHPSLFSLPNPGNYADPASVRYPSGLRSSVHHLISLRKLII